MSLQNIINYFIKNLWFVIFMNTLFKKNQKLNFVTQTESVVVKISNSYYSVFVGVVKSYLRFYSRTFAESASRTYFIDKKAESYRIFFLRFSFRINAKRNETKVYSAKNRFRFENETELCALAGNRVVFSIFGKWMSFICGGKCTRYLKMSYMKLYVLKWNI